MTTHTNLQTFIARYSPELASQLRGARSRLRKAFPRGYELVYDNFNALVFAFSASKKQADLVLSIAAYPRWVSLFFANGARLPDPHGLLKGSGSRIRHVVLASASDLDSPAIRALIAHATKPLAKTLATAPKLTTVIRAVSASSDRDGRDRHSHLMSELMMPRSRSGI